MSFRIPKNLKELNSIQTEAIIPVTLNDVDVDRMMAHVFELCAHSGRIKISKTKPDQFPEYVKKLAESGRITGLDLDERQTVLEGWLASTIVKVGQKGRSRGTRAMDFARPVSLACYRSGLPKGRVRSRQADILIYRAMQNQVRKMGEQYPNGVISSLVLKAFGEGILLTENAVDEPRYDGSEIDINALLALTFFEEFEQRSGRVAINERYILLPGAVDPIGRDAIEYLAHYGTLTSTLAGTNALSAMFGLRLLQLPLRTAIACRTLLGNGNWVPDVLDGDSKNPLTIYCDFTQQAGSPSDLISQQCVQRDLEVLRQFFTDRILLRSVHLAWKNAYSTSDTSKFTGYRDELKRAVDVMDEPEMLISLRMQVQSIENSLPIDSDGDEDRLFIQGLRESGLDGAAMLSRILNEGLQGEGLSKQIQWYWNCGGIAKSYGLLKGSAKARSSWRYAPSDDLLLALLVVSFVSKDGTRPRRRMPIGELLQIFKDRFGLLIDEVPPELQSSDARSAVLENRQAFIRRLQLLGCFRGLSDDFAAQFVENPMGGEG
jgi:hypothetical protein